MPYGSKPEYGMDSYNKPLKGHSGAVGPGMGNSRWHQSSSQKHRIGKKLDHSSLLKGKPSKYSLLNIDSNFLFQYFSKRLQGLLVYLKYGKK